MNSQLSLLVGGSIQTTSPFKNPKIFPRCVCPLAKEKIHIFFFALPRAHTLPYCMIQKFILLNKLKIIP